MASPYAKTLDQITDDALLLAEDYRGAGQSGRLFTRAEVLRAVNEALLEAVNKTECLKGSGTVSIVAGTSTYDLPSDCLRPIRMGLSGLTGFVILPVRISDVDLLGLARSGTGSPYELFREFLGYNQFGVYPTPNDIGTMTIDYVAAPVKLVNTWDSPEEGIPVSVHKDLSYGAAIRLLSDTMASAPKPNKMKRFNERWARIIARTTEYCRAPGRALDFSPC